MNVPKSPTIFKADRFISINDKEFDNRTNNKIIAFRLAFLAINTVIILFNCHIKYDETISENADYTDGDWTWRIKIRYLTMWGLYLTSVYFVFSFIAIWRQNHSTLKTVARFHHILTTWQYLITLFWYVVIRKPVKDFETTDNVLKMLASDLIHGPQLVLLLVDGLFIKEQIKASFENLIEPWLFGITYVVWNYSLFHFYDVVVYNALDWKTNMSLVFVIAASLIILVGSCVNIQIRKWIHRAASEAKIRKESLVDTGRKSSVAASIS